VAEGANVPLSRIAVGWPAPVVAAVLGDALHRIAMLGGRDGMPRSLGSVYGGAVTRFLGGSFRGGVNRILAAPGVYSASNGVAVSRDGTTLLVSDSFGVSHAIHQFKATDGSRLRVIGGKGEGPLQFQNPRQVCIAPDDFVFVADFGNDRVQVLTPRLKFHAYVGVGELNRPAGVCANADVVAVSEQERHRVSVFNRGDGALLYRFGSEGSGDGQLHYPHGLCFTSDDRHVAVADHDNSRVSVFSVDGYFVRHVGIRELHHPQGVACSAFDELVVADSSVRRLLVFSASGDELSMSLRCGSLTGVAMHHGTGTLFAQDLSRRCVVLQ
jgi:DNA-binding beta-propeller fold protein YncE